MGSIGMPELILIFLAILLIFGAKRIPEIARGLGKGIREFKDATRDIQRELTVEDSPQIQAPRPPAQTPTPRTEAKQETGSSGTASAS
ncbi:twin-arginine translocase TatA/TatE family subunit [Rhodocaloribacter litoris]|uniref:twin-arginine translocase TatA/TatE family subunit n=1 Tax=Rhodocaloribacter litoris TaxID=2558931 RepID=UPI000F221BF9|nr:twin-arginine translocase TatA/TatE family subunit [Rhodocaloribacter litoris]QXD16792.1 twin-arginine translocase TatA/TatE family subunit [Rhodocaloribacter litoris]RMF63098.1 MAG: twin-arginine translocase TatA/TatE family subunit [Bacteroidota bacterium]GIV57435.1 MAG: hypothetical protein KatS3mg042_0348 [Rhodothermaceae bacterium]